MTRLGIALGLSGAAAANQISRRDVVRTDAARSRYAAVAFVFALVAALASYVPVLRATNVDQVVALRYE